MPDLFDRLQTEIELREKPKGISPLDLLELPAALSDIINQIIRHYGLSLEEIAERLEQDPAETRQALDELVQQGYIRPIETEDAVWYKANFGHRLKKNKSDVWSVLDDILESD